MLKTKSILSQSGENTIRADFFSVIKNKHFSVVETRNDRRETSLVFFSKDFKCSRFVLIKLLCVKVQWVIFPIRRTLFMGYILMEYATSYFLESEYLEKHYKKPLFLTFHSNYKQKTNYTNSKCLFLLIYHVTIWVRK